MKRLPLVLTLVALVALAASIAYWVLQLFQPPQHTITAAPIVAVPEPSMDAAATLFGGQAAAAVATNFQLTGVISAGMQSVAIIAANGAPAKALVIGKEVAPGVTVSEVHARYVMLSDGGVMKRIDLAADTKPPAAMGAPGAAVAPAGGAQAPAPLPAPEAAVEAEAAHPDTTPRDEPQPAPAIPAPPPSNAPAVPSAANPPLSPGAVQQLPAPAQAPATAPATAPAQMPAPVRSPGSPVTQPPSSR
jgi:general secretion pathway protein C